MPRPHAGQQDIITEANRFNVVVCGRRFGKSILGEDRIVPVAAAGYPTAWFAPDYKSLLEVWRDLKRILAPITERVDQQQKRLELITGGLVEFWSMDRDPEQCRGRKYKRVVLDEAAKARHLELAWTQAILPTILDLSGDAWFLTTPRGRDFLWKLWQRGNDPDWTAWASWQKPTAANPFMPPSGIEAMRAEMPTTVFNQEVLAQFLDVGGRFFDEWEAERGFGDERVPWHVVTPYPIDPANHRFTGGLDFGTRSPFSFHLGATNRKRDLLIIDEEYKEGLLPKAQAALVVECLHRNKVPKDGAGRFDCLIAADPSMFPPKEPLKRLGEYPIEEFWAAGLKCARAINNRHATNVRARQWMHEYRIEIDARTGEETALPRLRVFEGRCKNLIRTIPLMVRLDKDPEDFDTTLEDHAVDSGLRYLAGSLRPKAPSAALVAADPEKSLPFELRSDPKEARNYE